jgi:hypothetical protein
LNYIASLLSRSKVRMQKLKIKKNSKRRTNQTKTRRRLLRSLPRHSAWHVLQSLRLNARPRKRQKSVRLCRHSP